ncbi:MotA/TolQ/ExbB proton channel family protein [Parapusillimonas granuli]|uniref:MotA/TolQ/ExbB proton channel family protein n=1 Tax=Parapusillimonas granuli TaxID=380911 RepID=A0A853G516_9BURK|nr:MotA/TolQ/ExbB proton channel family protein [Parapusillimonas granuli]MBB5217502.1 biopolymer transport protein ExbB/TolQ [Parapusillimonas granuli]NYT51267.1 MotA/TolQ/ExbB proton channel family protein [Parapusillimonas granuli]NYT80280.1 MotA/TolQ/ExbB proton channel family protein [Alcaligenaceae bacterium]
MSLKLILEQLSQFLFQPVLALLVVLVVWTLVALGMFVRSLVSRRRGRKPAVGRFTAQIDAVAAGEASDADLCIERVLAQAEHDSLRSLNAVRFAVRAGPSLGLMGTLIPMAAALSGLARGDLPALSEHMVVAFSATIVGIAIGVVAHVIAMVREGWQRQDLDDIRLHAEQVLRAHETTAQKAVA